MKTRTLREPPCGKPVMMRRVSLLANGKLQQDESGGRYRSNWVADDVVASIWSEADKTELAGVLRRSDQRQAAEGEACAHHDGAETLFATVHATAVRAAHLVERAPRDRGRARTCLKCKDNTEGGGYECALPPPALTASEHARLGRELCSLRLAILSEGWLLPPLARGVSGKGITEERRRLLLHLSLQRQPPSKAEVDVATEPVVEDGGHRLRPQGDRRDAAR